MPFIKKRRRRWYSKSSSSLYNAISNFARFTLREICIFLILISILQSSCTGCGPTPTSSGRKSTLLLSRSQAVSSNDDQSVADGDGNFESTNKLIWDINRWIPENFRDENEQEIVRVLNSNLRSAFGAIEAKTFDSGSGGTSAQSIVCPSELNCDFSNWRLCRWRNSRRDDDTEFYIGEGEVDSDRLQLYGGTRITPNSPFLLTAANQGDYKVWLVSDVIPEQPGDGTLEFRFWLTPLVELRICTRSVAMPDLLTCSDSLSLTGAPGPALVTIPGPIREPFEILFEVKNFITEPGGVVFIDDIVYSSSLCDEDPQLRIPSGTILGSPPSAGLAVTRRGGSSVSSIRSTPKTQADICEAIPCSFDNGNNCGYDLLSPGASVGWRVNHGAVGNRATGIQRDVNGLANSTNSYLLATGERRGQKDLFIARTIPFRLDRTLSVRFFRHLLSSGSQLRVCLVNTSTICPATFRIDISALDWQESLVDLSPNDLPDEYRNKPVPLLFIAEGLKQNNFIGIDNIELRERNGSPAC